MKVIQHPSLPDEWKCPICDTNKDEPVVLVEKNRTSQVDYETVQYHLACIHLEEIQPTNDMKVLQMPFFIDPVVNYEDDDIIYHKGN